MLQGNFVYKNLKEHPLFIFFLNNALFKVMKTIRQLETSCRWKYNTTHALCMMVKKSTNTLQTFENYYFSEQQLLRDRSSISSYTQIFPSCSLMRDMNWISIALTADPISSALKHVLSDRVQPGECVKGK